MPEIPPLISGTVPVPHFLAQDVSESSASFEMKKEAQKKEGSFWSAIAGLPRRLWNKYILR